MACRIKQGRPLYFCPVVSIFFLLLSSSPNLTGRRLDVYHTTTHGVASVRIQNAVLKCVARGLLEIQDAKNTPKARYLGTIAQSSDCRFATKACIDKREKLVKQQYLLHMSPQYGELRSIQRLTYRFGSFGAPQQITTGFASWLRYCTDVAQRRLTKLCTMFGTALVHYIHLGGTWPLTEFYQVQNLLCVQVVRSILAALLHGTRVVSVSQTLRR